MITQCPHDRIALFTEEMLTLKRITLGKRPDAFQTHGTRKRGLLTWPILSAPTCSRALHFFAERIVEPTRDVPECIDEDGKSSYVQIAQRARNERRNFYTIFSIGIELFLIKRRLETGPRSK
jgi:hypothetical protein